MKVAIYIPLFLLASVALGQTTRPATQPSLVGVRPEYLRSLQTEVEKLRDEVARLRKENEKLRANQPPAVDEKIAAAMKEGRLAVGMTLPQADAALKKKFGDFYVGYHIEKESGGETMYEFRFAPTYQGGRLLAAGSSWWAWISDGKIIEWGKE